MTLIRHDTNQPQASSARAGQSTGWPNRTELQASCCTCPSLTGKSRRFNLGFHFSLWSECVSHTSLTSTPTDGPTAWQKHSLSAFGDWSSQTKSEVLEVTHTWPTLQALLSGTFFFSEGGCRKQRWEFEPHYDAFDDAMLDRVCSGLAFAFAAVSVNLTKVSALVLHAQRWMLPFRIRAQSS